MAVTAAVLGAQLAYLEGRRCGLRASAGESATRAGTGRSRSPRYGLPGVIAGRFLAGARTVVPRVAGSTTKPYQRFSAGSACAAVVWASAELLAGHAAASLTWAR
ncbi:DedA family protein [Amycolatopsis magusensis]|uniref:Membrane protein DedA with SNARE-associated domain n=1 Tax=Amycolatopsis magusensis TaxID=882444 RepID=A0ABS4PUH6_9PSEU|nr:VTT domain-containing protein [Amycolatopsis magusensis]MBP2183074.1 membrane protein DedA with SNARE-associated domain [Amycolatopsis magusensis]